MEFAGNGVLFRQAFNAGPTCSPSRAGLLTGMSAHSSGMIGLAHRGFSLNDHSRHLASFLSKNGYETVLCGVQHEAHGENCKLLGYEKIIISEKNLDDIPDSGRRLMKRDEVNADETARFIRGRKDRRPLFLSYGMISTHRPYPEIPDSEINPDNVAVPPCIFDNSENRMDMASFMTMAKTVDNCFAKVMSAIRAAGLEDDSLIIFTTDHGIAFPHMKCNLYDTGIGVALLMKFPGGKFSGKTVDALVSQTDIFPTICDLAGIQKPSWLEGKSFLPVLNGEKEKVRNEIFSEVTYHAAYEPMRCIRTERYKLIRHYDSEFQQVVLPNIDNGLAKKFLMRNGLKGRKKQMVQLFDLYFDPAERENLAERPEYAELMKDLSARLEKWMKDTDDPLLKGYVPKPQGAIANIKYGYEPGDKEYE